MDELEQFEMETDLADVVALLDGPPPEPSFVLKSSRYHAIKAKADMKASRRGIKSLIRPENARAILPQLPSAPGDRLHCILRGDFVLCDLIPAIIAERGRCEHLHLATLGLSTANAETLAQLVARGLVGRITLVCSLYFAQVDRATTFREVSARLESIAEIIVCRNHAKVICLPTASGDHFTIEGSANIRSSDNLEQIVIFNDPATLAFHCAWMHELSTAPS